MRGIFIAGSSLVGVAIKAPRIMSKNFIRARFTVVVDSFIKTGSRFGEAFLESASFLAIRPLFEVRPLWVVAIKR